MSQLFSLLISDSPSSSSPSVMMSRWNFFLWWDSLCALFLFASAIILFCMALEWYFPTFFLSQILVLSTFVALFTFSSLLCFDNVPCFYFSCFLYIEAKYNLCLFIWYMIIIMINVSITHCLILHRPSRHRFFFSTLLDSTTSLALPPAVNKLPQSGYVSKKDRSRPLKNLNAKFHSLFIFHLYRNSRYTVFGQVLTSQFQTWTRNELEMTPSAFPA